MAPTNDSPSQTSISGGKRVSPTKTAMRNRFLAARDNPLCIEKVTAVRFRHSQYDWEHHLDRLSALNFRAAIVGRKGSGKTTLLNELKDRLDDQGIDNRHVFLPQETDSHRLLLEQAIAGSKHKIILLDGIERITFLQRRNLMQHTRRGRGIVMTAHRTSRIPTWIQCQTDVDLMQEILTELNLVDPEVQLAGRIAFVASKGNIRLALRDLYDQFSSGKFNAILSR